MSRSAALCGGNRKRWQQQWSKEHTGNTSCSEPSNWRPTNTERKQEGKMRMWSCPQRQKDFSVNESVNCTEMVWRQRSPGILLALEVILHHWLGILPPEWSFRVNFSCILLLLKMLLTSCEMRTWGSLLSDGMDVLPVVLCTCGVSCQKTHLFCKDLAAFTSLMSEHCDRPSVLCSFWLWKCFMTVSLLFVLRYSRSFSSSDTWT